MLLFTSKKIIANAVSRPLMLGLMLAFAFGTIQAQTIVITRTTTGTLKAGDVIGYKCKTTNNTASVLTGLSIADAIPASPFQYVPNSLIVSGTDLTCSVPTSISSAIAISGFNLLPGESLVYEFKMKVPETYSGTTTIAHTATYGSATASVSNNVSALASLSISKTGVTDVTTGSVNKTGLIYYTVSVTNTGTAAANAVTVSDAIPTTKVGIVANNLVTVALNYIGSYTVVTGNSTTDGNVVVTLGNIPPGGSAVIKFRVRVKTGAVSPIVNTASAAGSNFTTVNSSATTHIINSTSSCANRDIYYLSTNGTDASAELNNPHKPWKSFKTIIDLINVGGGNAVLKFLDAYYPTTSSGSTNPILTTSCVTIDGNYCIFDRNSGASVGFLEIANGGNGDTIRNLRLTNFNKSPNCSFDIYGTSPAVPVTGLVVDDVDVFATQSVKATNFVNVSGAKFTNCDWANNPFGAIDIVDAKITFTNCTWSCNTRGGFGGAINANLKSGGAGSDMHFTDLTFVGGTFSKNSGTGSAGDGGAIYCAVGTLTIQGTEFDCNSTASTTGGGAIRIGSGSASSGKPIVAISDAVFYNNSATSGDGAAILRSTSTGAFSIDKCIFKGNNSNNGIVSSNGSTFTVNNSIFTNNLGTGSAISGSPASVDSVTIKNNGKGVSGTIASLTNSLICSNTGVNISAQPTSWSNSLFGISSETVNNAVLTATGYPEACASATAGWTFTNGTTTTAIQSAAAGDGGANGYWLVERNDVITSPNIDVTGKTNVKVQFRTATFGTVASAGSPVLEYFNGTTWVNTTGISTPTNTTYIYAFGGATNTQFNIGSPNITTLKLRFMNPTAVTAGAAGMRIDNITVTYDNPIACSSTSVGSNVTVGTYACIGTCPTNPTAANNCISFADLGNVSLGSGCKFLNTYTGDFAAATPVQLQSGQSITANVSNFFFVNSPANTYQWRWLVVNPAGNIVQVVTPTNHTTSVSNTAITPSFSPVTTGTYLVYGYYFNASVTTAPTVGTSLATLALDKCGSLSKTFSSFEVLKPIQILTSATCVDADFNACTGRYYGNMTITGGYPEYANGKGLMVPQYVVGTDITYAPTSYTNEMSSWVSYNTATKFAINYVNSSTAFGAKVEDDKNCNLYPYTLNVAAFAMPSDCGLSITGTVMQDANGLTDNTLSGAGQGAPSSNTLYAYLYYTSGGNQILLAKTTVNSNGTYSFGNGFAPNQNYKVAISSTNITGAVIGSPLPALTLPTDWVNVGEGLGTVDDGAINALTSVVVATSNVAAVNFGIERRPTVTNSTATGQSNPGGTTFVAASASLFSNTDTDGTVTGLWVENFPANAAAFSVGTTTYYPNAGAIPGTCPTASCLAFPSGGITISATNGQPNASISIDPNDGTFVLDLFYKAIDNAGYPSLTSGKVSLPITAPLPIKLLYFKGQKQEEGSNLLEWATATEQNNAYFVLEHSTDAIEFSVLGNINGAGNSNSLRTYHYLHANPAKGINYYRLKQVDTDGGHSNSHIVALQNGAVDTELQVFPNPVNDLLSFKGNVTVNSIKLYNALGQLVLNEIPVADHINLQYLAGGMYYVIFQTSEGPILHKITKK